MNDVAPLRDENPGAAAPLVCGTCGTRPQPGGEARARLTWSRGMSGSATTWTCEHCSREHVRAIEGKLDPDWW